MKPPEQYLVYHLSRLLCSVNMILDLRGSIEFTCDLSKFFADLNDVKAGAKVPERITKYVSVIIDQNLSFIVRSSVV